MRILPAIALVAAAAAPTSARAFAAESMAPDAPTAAAAARPDAGGAVSAGDAGAPAPLAAWMKAQAGPAAAGHDLGSLAAALETIADFAPRESGYPSWASIARDGAAAARAGEIDAARASCRGCHATYRAKYKAELHARALPRQAWTR